MVSVKRFEISLSNSKLVYKAGDTVEGCVTVDLFSPMKTKVRLQVTGTARVLWKETYTANYDTIPQTKIRHHSAKKTYFNYSVDLFDPKSGQGFLSRGNHDFPFSVKLPCDIPSSFESGLGYVRYYVRAKLDQPWMFDHYMWKVFTVIRDLDLNEYSLAHHVVQGQATTDPGFLCCRSGPISAQFQIDRTGYVPGDVIFLNAEITNDSSANVRATTVKMFMSTMYKATTATRKVNMCLAALSRGEIPAGGNDVWSRVPLPVPAIPPSYLTGCEIDIRYTVQLDVIIEGGSSHISIPLEVVIGTIPLNSAMPSRGLVSPEPASPQSPLSASEVNSSQQKPTKAPPSYEECVLGLTYLPSVLGELDVTDDDEREEHVINGNRTFVPLYPFYDRSKIA